MVSPAIRVVEFDGLLRVLKRSVQIIIGRLTP
jgi:hypothetical protein